MSYCLEAVLGSSVVLEQLAKSRRCANTVALRNGLYIIPMIDELFEDVNEGNTAKFGDPSFDRFKKLTPRVNDWLVPASNYGALAYLEAEFWGGTGAQSSVVWQHRRIVHGPEHSQWAINKALRHLGVKAYGNILLRRMGIYRHYFKDEFDVVGLSKFRHTQDWLQASNDTSV